MSIKYKNNGTWVEAPVNVIQKTDIPEEALTISGECDYRFAYGGWNWFIEKYGDQIITKDITACNYMFAYNKTLTSVPFDINCNVTNSVTTLYMFYYCNELTDIPKIAVKPTNMQYMFYGCYKLRNLPEDIATWFDWSYLESSTSGYNNASNLFESCFSLRSIPMDFLSHFGKNTNYNYTNFKSGFRYCYALDELVGLPLPYTATWTSNAFSDTFDNCSRLKNLTFALDPETNAPYVRNWKSQTIDLSDRVGYADYNTYIIDYNSGITADKRVQTENEYQSLKNDPDWFTTDYKYSRYNHDSAVATINSLPDTSAYLAANGGTNTIKFKGTSGSATDGGAINTLTAEEIAVATAKGWTVTFA